jgi:hypothetical protein
LLSILVLCLHTNLATRETFFTRQQKYVTCQSIIVSTPSGQRTIERKVIVTTPGQLEATRQVNICHRNHLYSIYRWFVHLSRLQFTFDESEFIPCPSSRRVFKSIKVIFHCSWAVHLERNISFKESIHNYNCGFHLSRLQFTSDGLHLDSHDEKILKI